MTNIREFIFTDPTPLRSVLRRLIARLKVGGYGWRVRVGAVDRPAYGFMMYQAAQLAARLGQERISVVEFGVAGGNGLVAMEHHAAAIEKLFPVKIDIYGFDMGSGLPAPRDYRDLPYFWRAGFFEMDQVALRSRLTRAKLIIGDVAETWRDFVEQHDAAPIGAVAHDLDFYSSTVDALNLFKLEPERFLPRVFCYFDDTIGSELELYSDYSGERLAIEEFNSATPQRKIAVPYFLRARQALGVWVNQIWIFHLFDHPRYSEFVGPEVQQLRLR